MTKAFKGWLRGLLSAFFSGVSGVLGLNFIDPGDFNLDNPGKLWMGAALFGIVGVVNYLSKSPLPPDEE